MFITSLIKATPTVTEHETKLRLDLHSFCSSYNCLSPSSFISVSRGEARTATVIFTRSN